MLKNRILTITLAAGIGLGLSGSLLAQDPPAWQGANNGREEYDLAVAAQNEPAAAARVTKLDAWRDKFPDSNYVTLRDDLYLITYSQVPDLRKAFDKAVEIRKTRPDHFLAINTVLTAVYTFQPASAADLTVAEQTAKYLMDHGDTVFAATNIPPTMTPEQWGGIGPTMLPFAQQTYAWVFVQRQDHPAAEREIKKYLGINPNNGQFSYLLGQEVQAQAGTNPERIVEALFHYMRAGNYSGENALPGPQRTQAEQYAKNLFKSYSGQDPAGPEYAALVPVVVGSALPPPSWKIESAQVRAQRVIDAENAWVKANPDWDFWNRAIVSNLKAADAADLFADSFVDALLPGEAGTAWPEGAFTRFRGTVVTADPADRPKTLTLAVGDPTKIDASVANVTLTMDQALPAGSGITAGMMVEFQGVAKSFTGEPFMLTMEVREAAWIRLPGAPEPGE